MAPHINLDTSTIAGLFGKSWLDQFFDQDDFWNDVVCEKVHKNHGYKVQPLGHTCDLYFPTSAFRYGLERWYPDAQTKFNISTTRGPKCEVNGKSFNCHANGYMPTFFYTHPEIECSVTAKKGLPTLICRWNEAGKLQACWDCYLGGLIKCPIGGVVLKEKTAEDNSRSTRSGRPHPPAPKKTQPPTKIPKITIPRPPPRRQFKVSPDDDEPESEEHSGAEDDDEERSEEDDGRSEGHSDPDDQHAQVEAHGLKRKRVTPPPYSPFTPSKRPLTNASVERSASGTQPLITPSISSPRPPHASELTPTVVPPPTTPSMPVDLPQSWLEARQKRIVTAPSALASTKTDSRPPHGFGGLQVAPAPIQRVQGAGSTQPDQQPQQHSAGLFGGRSGAVRPPNSPAEKAPERPPNSPAEKASQSQLPSERPPGAIPDEFEDLVSASEQIRSHLVQAYTHGEATIQQAIKDMSGSLKLFKSSAESYADWWSGAEQSRRLLLSRLKAMQQSSEQLRGERDEVRRHLRSMEDAWRNSEEQVKRVNLSHDSAANLWAREKKDMEERIAAAESRVETMQTRFGEVVSERQASDEAAHEAQRTRDEALAEARLAREQASRAEAELSEAERIVSMAIKAKVDAETRASAAEQRVAVVEALLNTTQKPMDQSSFGGVDERLNPVTTGKPTSPHTPSAQGSQTQPARTTPTWQTRPKEPESQDKDVEGQIDDPDADLYV